MVLLLSSVLAFKGLIVLATGKNVTEAIQGVIGPFASRSGLGATYSTLALLQLAGGMIGTVAFAWVFELGSHLDGEERWGLGLPFWTSVVCTIYIPSLCFLRLFALRSC